MTDTTIEDGPVEDDERGGAEAGLIAAVEALDSSDDVYGFDDDPEGEYGGEDEEDFDDNDEEGYEERNWAAERAAETAEREAAEDAAMDDALAVMQPEAAGGEDEPVDEAGPLEAHLTDVSVKDLYPHPDNPRRELLDLDGLAASIRAEGVLQPLLVTGREGKRGYWLVAGHRRHAAAVMAGAKTVPCVVRAMTPLQVAEAMVVENGQREDLSPVEMAVALANAIRYKMKAAALAKKVGMSVQTVKRRLLLLTLPDALLDQVHAGELSLETAEQAILVVKEPGGRELLAAEMTDERAYGGVRGAVSRAAQKQRNEQQLADANGKLDELKAAGVTVARDEIPAAWKPLSHLNIWGADAEAHRAEPCHAAAINGYTVATYCSDPKRHKGTKPASAIAPAGPVSGGGPKPSKEEKALQKQQKAARRVGFQKALAKKTRLEARVAPLVYGTLLDLSTPSIAETALELLGIEPAGTGWNRGVERLRAEVDAGGARAAKAAAAVTFAVMDDKHRGGSGATERLDAWLVGEGQLDD